MTKIVLAGITVCATAVLITGANATERHYRHRYYHSYYHGMYQGPIVAPIVREPVYRPPVMTIPEHPVANDCIHVMFPQCDKGPN